MSGLLQRLAARATGSAWALRSDARLPFSGSPGVPEMHGVEPREPAVSHRPAQAVQARATVTPQLMVPLPEPTPATTPPLARAQQMAATEDPAAADTPRLARAQPALTRAQATAQPLAHGGRPPGSVSTAPHPATEQMPPPFTRGPTADADPEPLLPTANERVVAKAPQTAAATAQPGTPRAPHALPPRLQALATPAPASEPTEVHVHIGRIEVTAITQPQAPKRAARERSQPLSLDAYLARRKEPS